MIGSADTAAQQRDFWNGPGSTMWVEQADRMDATLAPVLDALLVYADVKRGERALDIGCGSGASVLELAGRTGPDGHVFGLDISKPLIDLARRRIDVQTNIRLELGDAATFPFPSAGADLLFSRFGVMFFSDPIAAFTNMRAAIASRGRACFACWQEIAANPWLNIPQSRIDAFLPQRPPSVKGIPGQFSFADKAWVAEVLTTAGFESPSFAPFEFKIPLGRTLDEAVERSCAFGSTGRELAEQPDNIRRQAAEAVREGLDGHVAADGSVALTGRVWIVTADVGTR